MRCRREEERKLGLKVNATKTKITPPSKLKYLGFGFWKNKDGWKAIVNHSQNRSGGRFEDDEWELYHVQKDYSENTDVAKEYPQKVKELEKLWYIEAARAGVFPMLSGTLYGSPEQAQSLIEHVVKHERFEEYRDIIEPVDILRTFFTVLNKLFFP